jgi:hypothetical protein
MNTLHESYVKFIGLSDKFIDAKVKYRYQKTGGIIVCPKCEKFLGFPKHINGIICRQELKTCPDCPQPDSILKGYNTKGIIKFAETITIPRTKTTIILITVDGETFTTSVRLNKEDKFDKAVARQCALNKLVKKIKSLD